MLGFLRTFKSRPLAQVTVFHNHNSLKSHQMLSKLNRLAELPCTYDRYTGTEPLPSSNEVGKFAVHLKENCLPSYQEYLAMHDFLDIHPENGLAFEKIYPIFFQNETLCKKSASLTNKKQKYLADLLVFTAEEYENITKEFKRELKSDSPSVFNAPLIVDWENSLIAVDEKGLDRIMANYLSCGTQQTQDFNHRSFAQRGTTNANSHTHVHPHVAEFADLF